MSHSKRPQSHASDPGLLPSVRIPSPDPMRSPSSKNPWCWEKPLGAEPTRGRLAGPPSKGVGATRASTTRRPHTLTGMAALGAPEVTHFPHFPLSFKTNQNADQHPLFVLGDQRKEKAVLWVCT